MVSTPTMSLDDVRADREAAQREQAERKAKYEKDKAAMEAKFQADMETLAALLADIDAVERHLQRRQQQSRPAPNGHDEPPERKEREDLGHDAGSEKKADDEPHEPPEDRNDPRTQKDLVLAAVRARPGSMRYHLDKLIQGEFHAAVPLTSISTYLHRLKDEGLIDNSGDGVSWYPVGGPSQ